MSENETAPWEALDEAHAEIDWWEEIAGERLTPSERAALARIRAAETRKDAARARFESLHAHRLAKRDAAARARQ